LGGEAAGSQPRTDQRLVAAHRRFDQRALAIAGGPLPGQSSPFRDHRQMAITLCGRTRFAAGYGRRARWNHHFNAVAAPRRHNLSSDGSFESVYIVRPHTVVHVHGRELGSQHRDAIYAVFRSRARKISEPNLSYVPGSSDPVSAYPRVEYYYTQTTWRELLLTTGRTAHVNNLGSLLRCFEEVRSVSFRVYQGSYDEYSAQVARGRLPGAGFSDNLINEIRWDGVSLDSQVTVK